MLPCIGSRSGYVGLVRRLFLAFVAAVTDRDDASRLLFEEEFLRFFGFRELVVPRKPPRMPRIDWFRVMFWAWLAWSLYCCADMVWYVATH